MTRNFGLGLFWSVVAGLLFVGVTATVRALGSDMNAVQSSFIRYLMGTALFLPMYWRLIRARQYPARRLSRAARGCTRDRGHVVVLLGPYPTREVTAMSFTSPIFVTVGAAIFLGERLQRRRITAVALGFLGPSSYCAQASKPSSSARSRC